MKSRQFTAVAIAAALSLGGMATSTAQALAPSAVRAVSSDPSTGTYYPVTPTRLLDTRTQGGPAGPQGIKTVQVLGRAGVPATGVSAVVINLTATAASASTFLTAYPSGKARPAEGSSINVKPGASIANNVTVQPGNDGKVAIYNNLGSTHVIVDIVGWYAADATYTNATGTVGGGFANFPGGRVYDNREEAERFHGGGYADVTWTLPDEQYAADIRAIAINVTATWATTSGNLTLWSGAGTKPTASTVNFVKGRAVANFAIVPVRHEANTISIRVSADTTGTVAPILDLVGSYEVGIPFVFRPIPQTRLFDTRKPAGATNALSGRIGERVTRKVMAGPRIVTPDTWTLVSNVTATGPSKVTHIDIWDGMEVKPEASTLNVVAGETRANAAPVPLDPEFFFSTYNDAGSTDLIMDVVGTFEFTGVPMPPSARAAAPQERAAKYGAPQVHRG